jgi:hypothetical protein
LGVKTRPGILGDKKPEKRKLDGVFIKKQQAKKESGFILCALNRKCNTYC